MRKKNNNAAYFAFSLFIVIGCLLISWQFLLPDYKQNRQSLLQTNEELTVARKKMDSLKTAKSQLSQISDVTSRLFSAVPEGVDAPNLITELEAIATKSQVYIPAVQTGSGSSESETTSNTVSVSFMVQGGFDNINTFLSSLEKDIRYVNVKTLSLTTSEDKMTLALLLEAYQRPKSSLLEASTSDGN